MSNPTRRPWGAFALALAAILLGTPSAGAYARTDPVDENYLTGFLGWDNGRGVIHWESLRDTEDNVDVTGDAAGSVDEFVSDPLPRHAYLNTSRVLQLDVFFQTDGAVDFNIELHTNDGFLGGGISGSTLQGTGFVKYCKRADEVGCADPSLEPYSPDYKVKSHRLQAELDELEKGTQVRLRILHVHAASAKALYGFGGDHASVLRIPLFSPDESVYRVPRFQERAGTPPAGDAIPTVEGLEAVLRNLPLQGLVAGSLLLGFLPGSRTRRTRVVWVLAALVLGSGCVASGPRDAANSPGSDLGGSASSYVVRDATNETGLAGPGRGSVYGRIADPEGLPIQGAHVFLLGTQNSSRTDPFGRFVFRDLLPGQVRIRADRDGFRSLEADVRIEAASITRVELTMDFLVPATNGPTATTNGSTRKAAQPNPSSSSTTPSRRGSSFRPPSSSFRGRATSRSSSTRTVRRRWSPSSS